MSSGATSGSSGRDTSFSRVGSSSNSATPLLPPLPIPPYIPLTALVPNPYIRPTVNPVYFSYYRCLFAIGSGPIRLSDLTLFPCQKLVTA